MNLFEDFFIEHFFLFKIKDYSFLKKYSIYHLLSVISKLKLNEFIIPLQILLITYY